MRNPWIHDDVPDDAGSGYGGRVRLLAAVVWGTLLLMIGGFVLLSEAGAIDLALAGSLGSAVTYVVAAIATVLLAPLIARLLAVSRLLGTAAFLGTGWLLGRFVWSRESERIARVLTDGGRLDAGAAPFGRLIELLDLVLTTA